MVKVKEYDIKGSIKKEVELSKTVFDVEPNKALISLVSRVHSSNKRRGLASTKEKHDVRGGGAKPFKQKGTGRGRQGSIRAPQYVGGGTVFGPRSERNFQRTIPQKMRRLALFGVLSDKAKNERLGLVDFSDWKGSSTSDFLKLCASLPKMKKIVFVLSGDDNKTEIIRSGRNVKEVSFTSFGRLPVDELLSASCVYFDTRAMEAFLKLHKITA